MALFSNAFVRSERVFYPFASTWADSLLSNDLLLVFSVVKIMGATYGYMHDRGTNNSLMLTAIEFGILPFNSSFQKLRNCIVSKPKNTDQLRYAQAHCSGGVVLYFFDQRLRCF